MKIFPFRNSVATRSTLLLLLAAQLSCNLPKNGNFPSAVATIATLPPTINTAAPSGLPTAILTPHSGFLFQTSQVVTDQGGRDIWWNNPDIVAGTKIVSLGLLDSPSIVAQVSTSTLVFQGFEPAMGETIVVEVGAVVNGYAIIRPLSVGSAGELNFEYLYPFTGQITP